MIVLVEILSSSWCLVLLVVDVTSCRRGLEDTTSMLLSAPGGHRVTGSWGHGQEAEEGSRVDNCKIPFSLHFKPLKWTLNLIGPLQGQKLLIIWWGGLMSDSQMLVKIQFKLN